MDEELVEKTAREIQRISENYFLDSMRAGGSIYEDIAKWHLEKIQRH